MGTKWTHTLNFVYRKGSVCSLDISKKQGSSNPHGSVVQNLFNFLKKWTQGKKRVKNIWGKMKRYSIEKSQSRFSLEARNEKEHIYASPN